MGPPSLENKADHSPNWIERPSARMHRGESREGGHDTTRCVGDGPRTTMHRRGPHAGLPRPCPGRNERTGDARHASLRHAAGVRQGKLVSQGTSPYQCAGRWCPLLPLPELSRNQLRPVSKSTPSSACWSRLTLRTPLGTFFSAIEIGVERCKAVGTVAFSRLRSVTHR
uniref:Uncharacterized protein n=1 Tax=Eutreptiella gymnastica TaxID=73025 RepID=A0A7S4FUA8_9EUGL